MEKIEETHPTKKLESISEEEAKEKQEAERRETNYNAIKEILGMFGTEKAKKSFLETMQNYYESYRAQKLSEITGFIKESERHRANLHNKIMETLKRLSLSPNITEEQEKVLRLLADRNKTNEVINDYFDVEIMFRRHPKMTKLGRMREGKFD